MYVTSDRRTLRNSTIFHMQRQVIFKINKQNGFRSGLSCTVEVFTLKQIIEKRTALSLSTHLVFVNLQNAYHLVPLNKLWTNMTGSSVCKTYVKAVKLFYSGCTSSFKVGKLVSPEFEVTDGLRQGCTLAPIHFKI